MAFQLRERDTTTLKEMQDSAINVEANLLIRRLKIKAEEGKKITKEQLESLESQLDILANTMKEMMPKFIMGNEIVFQRHHVPLVMKKERVTIPKHFAAHPWYHGLERKTNKCEALQNIWKKILHQKRRMTLGNWFQEQRIRI
jgi:hypothetical protein